MENLNLLSGGALEMIVAGGLVTFLTQFIKAKFPKVDPKFIVILLAVLGGVGYQAIAQFAPVHLKLALTDFVAGASGVSVLIYEFFKKTEKKIEEQASV